MNLERAKIVNILDKIILFSLYAFAYFFPISKAIIGIASYLAIGCFILKKIIQYEESPKTYLNLAIFIYLVVCFISIFLSSNFQISSRAFLSKVLQRVALFVVIADTLNTERRIRNFIYIFFISSLLLGIDGIYQHFTHKDFIRNRPDYGLPRIHATFPTPNDFGCYLVTAMTFTLTCFFVKSNSRMLRLVFSGLFMLLFVCLVLTVSRGAWFAFISVVLFMSFWIRPLGISFLILAISVMLAQQFYNPLIKERLTNFFIFQDNSSLDRIKIWEAGWKMLMSRPWAGVGLGTFMFNFSSFAKDYRYNIVPYAHNCYLQMSAEIGIIGLVSFLAILILFFYQGIKLIRRMERTFSWYMLLGSLAALLGYCVVMAVDTNFYALDLGMLFWMLLGIGVASMNNLKLQTAVSK
ncbi:MAG: O-antigen ligase family protein [Candidatus Omnitrophica bacterium]|nr:O-antigen ligase family protein [Candidatus Omnitrophota bacterium]